MTAQQIVEWLEAFRVQSEEKIKETASLLNGQALQIISGVAAMLDKRGNFLTLPKLYPDLFGEPAKRKKMSPEEIENARICVWHNFLGV